MAFVGSSTCCFVGRSVIQTRLVGISPDVCVGSGRSNKRDDYCSRVSVVSCHPNKRIHGAQSVCSASLHFSHDNVTMPTTPTMQKKLPFYVMMPSDAVTTKHTISHCKAIKAGFLALKALGVDGVVVQMYWGIVEGDSPKKYEWSAYYALVEMLRSAGLKAQVSICFHGNQDTAISLPRWVHKVGERNPDIFFTDRMGNRYRDCLSLSIDNYPLFEGRTNLQIFSDFLTSFRSTFSKHLGDAIVGVSIGLGPDGELKYPSIPNGMPEFPGMSEFQCYDKYMLACLKRHFEAIGYHEFKDATTSYNEQPLLYEREGTWSSYNRNVFLSWYTSQLIAHGDRILSLTARIFKDDNIKVSGKISFGDVWQAKDTYESGISEGYHIEDCNGYDAVMEMFSRNRCSTILGGIENFGASYGSETLLQIKKAALMHGVEVGGENSYPCWKHQSLQRIMDSVYSPFSSELPPLASFTFRSMGQSLFFPDHWHRFVNFFRSIRQYELTNNGTHLLQGTKIHAYRCK